MPSVVDAKTRDAIPVTVGAVVTLIVHLGKTAVRPAANVATAGVAAPILSTIEDIVSLTLVALAIVVPVLALVVVALLVWGATRIMRRRRRKPVT